MKSEELIKAVIELVILGLQIYFIYWTITTVKKLRERFKTVWRTIDDLKNDNKLYYKEIMNLNQKIKEIEENNNTPE